MTACTSTTSAEDGTSGQDYDTNTPGMDQNPDEDTEIEPVLEDTTGWQAPEGRAPRFVFVHHSTGSGFMFDGGMADMLEEAGFEVHSRTYGDGWVGDNTNPDHFPVTFTEHFEDLITWDLDEGEYYDIVAFKSCYPASNICSDEKLEQYKGYYETVRDVTREHPEILFVPMSTPPLVPGATERHCAERARQFANWLVNVYPVDEGNMAVFNLFEILAGDDSNSDDFNCLKSEYQRNASDSHPNHDANVAVAERFTQWLNWIVFGE